VCERGESEKKTQTTPDTGGEDKRTTKYGPEFLTECRDFPLDKDDTWEPIVSVSRQGYQVIREKLHSD
jgi:hypothetical protein